MNAEKVSGDSMIVCGTPIPDEKKIDIPPKSAGKKVIEEGEVVINLESNTKELVDKVNRKYGKEDKDR